MIIFLFKGLKHKIPSFSVYGFKTLYDIVFVIIYNPMNLFG
jgi:hypothetical protein